MNRSSRNSIELSTTEQNPGHELRDEQELNARLDIFSSHTAYDRFLASLVEDREIHARLLIYLAPRTSRMSSQVYTTSQYCSIFDMVNEESRKLVTSKFDSNSPQSSDILSALDVIKALLDIPAQISLRIIIWHLDRDWAGIGVMTVLSVTLGLDFGFFRALFAKIAEATLPETSNFPETELQPLYAEHVIVGDYVIAFGNIDIPGESSVPYILIASGSSESYWAGNDGHRNHFAKIQPFPGHLFGVANTQQ